MTPLISVYITNHNYEKYIEKAILSVLGQTLQNFELIIIDDGSTDNSRAVIEKFSGDSRVRILFQENRGLNITNNIALRAARGKYVMRLDADDWLDENALLILSNCLERKPEVGLVFPDYYHVDGDGQIVELVRRHNFRKEVTLLDSPAHGACTMIRRQCLLDLGGYTEEFTCQDGYDLWLRFVEHYEVENVNLPLFFYRRHDKNLTGNETRILETRAKIVRNHSRRMKKGSLETLAIVPVRGPKLDPTSIAFQPLGDKTFLDWTIEAALEAEEVKWLVVSSPDEGVLEYVAKRYGSKVATESRPVKMARENVPLKETMSYIVDRHCQEHGDPGALLSLTIESPFRSAKYINKAIDQMKIFELDSVIGVRIETDIFYKHDGNGLEPVRKTSDLRLEREELYRQVGGITLCRYEHFKKTGSFLGGRTGHIVLDQKAAMRAGSEIDLTLMRALLEQEKAQQVIAISRAKSETAPKAVKKEG